MAGIVDSHCHLDFPELCDRMEEVQAAAKSADVVYMQTICTRVSQFDRVLRIAEAYPNVGCSVGQHPNNAEQDPLVTEEELLAHAARPKTIGIGETGLDYYYEKAPRELQQESFRVHIAASRKTGLPLIVHTRDAEEDTLKILREETEKGAFPFLIHCFTASMAFAESATALGGYISVAGVVTFKNAAALQEAVRNLPLERLLVETDSPYLAPVPHRGKPNMPAYTAHVVAKIAELKGLGPLRVADATTENFRRLFTKADVVS
jgi:TatD DNase family protein